MTEGRRVERGRDNDAFTAIAFAMMRLCKMTLGIGIDRALIAAQISSSYPVHTYEYVYIYIYVYAACRLYRFAVANGSEANYDGTR